MSTVAEDVQMGAALLDEHSPGWDARLDLATLCLADGDKCVLGQLFGDYADGLSELRTRADYVQIRARDYGFFPRVSIDDLEHCGETGNISRDRYEQACALLDQEWRRLVTARRLAKAQTAVPAR